MPTFPTPEPISVTIDLPNGDVWIIATDRADTVVDVRPNDESDIAAAEETRVEFSGGKLLIKAPKRSSPFGMSWLLGSGDSVDVRIELPAGSSVVGEAGQGGFRCEGPLGDCRLRTDYGDIQLDQVGAVRLTTDSGEISVERVSGTAEITTSCGDVRIGEIAGAAVIKNDHGECELGEVTGDLELNALDGDISIERALGNVEAKTAHGSVRIGEVVRGLVALTTAAGDLEVGIREGTAAWLDVRSMSGTVQSALEPRDGPDQFEETVEVRARSQDGDILIRRSSLDSGRRWVG